MGNKTKKVLENGTPIKFIVDIIIYDTGIINEEGVEEINTLALKGLKGEIVSYDADLSYWVNSLMGENDFVAKYGEEFIETN